VSTSEQIEAREPRGRDALSSVRRHPDWYFRTGRFAAVDAIALLTDEALSHGAPDVSSRKIGDCWVLQSSHDWLDGDLASFFALVPDPERGPNTSRVEILLTAFCEAVWTSRSGQLYDVTARMALPAELVELLADSSLGRVIAFVPPPGDVTDSTWRKSAGKVHPRLRLVEDDDLNERYDEAFLSFPGKEQTIAADSEIAP
jgi:hypothetical protein